MDYHTVFVYISILQLDYLFQARSLSREVGISGMYTGVVGHLCGNLSSAFVTMAANIVNSLLIV